jgi:peroxiredoxin
MGLHLIHSHRTIHLAGIALGLALSLVAQGPAHLYAARLTHGAVRCGTTATGTRVGTCAATFALPDTHGRRIDLTRYRGHPVLLNFCGPGCPYCAEQLPVLQTFAVAFMRQGGVILGVDVEGNARDILVGYARDNHVAWPLLVDPRTRVSLLYGVSATPTNVFIDRRGVIRAAEDTPLTPQDFRRLSKGL